ncbi:DUF192 domain-containing protein [Candidatus Peregrinibacteria bacterium]|nr:DUF192 domain-containing protein [Candidatus Peregrinibacteria bacterium]
MMLKRVVLVLGCLILIGCGVSKKNAGPQSIALVSPDQKAVTLTVEVADDPEERMSGLMGRKELPKEHGMIFLFQEPGVLSFWMKNTLIPLDIIFFDQQGKYISHGTMVPCTADPCPQYASLKPAAIALEVNAGFVAAEGVGEGWRIALPVHE